MSAHGEIAALIAPVQEGLKRMREIVALQLGEASPAVRDMVEHVGRFQGKQLRGALVLLSGEASGNSTDEHAAISAVVEMIHLATLVHDDVLDMAPLRRGRPTVFASAGRDAAAQTGDLLFARAFALLAANDDAAQVRALSDAASALARGELFQRADAWDASIPVARYLQRCDLKTARLFRAACELGAPALGEFGRRIGLAFQILDDVLDVAGPAERTGKHRGTDLLDGTVTLPLILARRHDQSLSGTVRCAEEAAATCDRIAATGALDEAREQALGYVSEAKRVLDGLELSEQRARALHLVADGVVERYA